MINPRPLGISPVNTPTPTPAPATTPQTSGTTQPASTSETHETHETHAASGTESHAAEEHHGGVKPLFQLNQTTNFSHGFSHADLGLGLRAGVQSHFGKGGHLEAYGTGRVFGNDGHLNTGLGLGVHGEYVFGKDSGFLTEAHVGGEFVNGGGHSSIDFHSEGRAGWRFTPGNTEINLTGGGGFALHGGHAQAYAVTGVETEFAKNKKVHPFVQADLQLGNHGASPQFTVGIKF